ncbi:LysR family transcriptional regulator [Kiloniella sp.]|uniref:LysR family transcriptional regulator n=1 Tax=Kiloniella sp. TaxID=1938587 RepID=UPI003B01038A
MDRFSAYRTFITVVAEGSMIKAAQKLNLTSSAISKQLSQLEHEMGVELIKRTTRSLAVSDEGIDFHRDCVVLLKQAEGIEEKLKSSLGDMVGKIKISWSQILMRGPLVDMLVEFSKAYPNIKIESVVSNRNLDFMENDLDFAFRTFLKGSAPSSSKALINSRTVVCASPQYLAEVGHPTSLEEILLDNLIVPSYLNLSDLRSLLSSYGELKHLDRYSSINDAIAYYHAVCAGMGFGLMQQTLIEQDLKSGALVEVLPDFKLRTLEVHLVGNDKSAPTPKTVLFKEFTNKFFETQ